MKDKTEKKETRKGFFSRMFEKLDKKIEEKAKSQPCCCKPSDKGGNSCCS